MCGEASCKSSEILTNYDPNFMTYNFVRCFLVAVYGFMKVIKMQNLTFKLKFIIKRRVVYYVHHKVFTCPIVPISSMDRELTCYKMS